MERIYDIDKEKEVILFEHRHRYEWASHFASGSVLDIACGIGYGSEIVIKNDRVTNYVGMDVSSEALDVAKSRFLNQKNISFELAGMEEIPLPDSSVDTVISLETLEHVDDVDVSIAEISRILTKEGIFVGSVPTADMEERCDEVYGSNPFHRRSFSKDEVYQALKKRFEFVRIGVARVVIGSVFVFDDEKAACLNGNNGCINSASKNQMGSFIFVASNEALNKFSFDRRFSFGMDFIEHDANIILPLRSAFKKAEEMVFERDAYIKVLEKKILSKKNIKSFLSAIFS